MNGGYFLDVVPNNGGGAVNVFQSNLKGIFIDDCSRYLASRLFGKFKLKGGGEIWLIDGVDGSDNVSGSDEDVCCIRRNIYWIID